jgi:hypothetical protein
LSPLPLSALQLQVSRPELQTSPQVQAAREVETAPPSRFAAA